MAGWERDGVGTKAGRLRVSVSVGLLQGHYLKHLTHCRPPDLPAGGKSQGAVGKPLLAYSHPAHPSFLASCWPWGLGEMTSRVGWLFLFLQLGLETLTPGRCGPETQLCQLPKRDKVLHARLRVYDWVCVRASVHGWLCWGSH